MNPFTYAALWIVLSAGTPARGPLGTASQLYDQGSFKAALAALDQAESETRDESVLAEAELLRGQCLSATGDLDGVDRAFAKALSHNPEITVDRNAVAPDLIQRFELLRRGSRGELIIRADQAEVLIHIDGRDGGKLPFRAKLAIGRHHLEASTADGRYVQKQEVVLRPDRTYEVALRLTRETPAGPAQPEAGSLGANSEPTDSTRLLRPLSYIAGGVGVISLGVGLGTALAERGIVAKMNDPATIQQYHASAETLVTASKVTTSIGLGAVAVGAALFVISTLRGSAPAISSASSTANPAVALEF